MHEVEWIDESNFLGNCQLCGAEDHLAPYGPDGKWICIKCGSLE